MSDAIALAAGAARATVRRRGAEWRMWAPRGRNLLWTPDPTIWPDVAPILFPVVGWTRGGAVRVGGRTYPLGLHGFARHLDFRLVEQDADRALLRLDDTADTRALFPFAFRFDVHVRLEPEAFRLAFEIVNTGETTLPYACGTHPGFAWPFAGGDPTTYQLRFDEIEASDVPVITADGLFAAARRRVPLERRTLPLTPDLFAREALCFLDARSRAVTFAAPDGPAIRVETNGFPHIALWSRPGAPFLAIESWTGHGDPAGFAGELFAKPSMRMLDPGGRARHEVCYRLLGA